MIGKRSQDLMNQIVVLILLFIGMIVVLTPLVWMMVSALKSPDAVNTNPPQWIPTEQIKVPVNGKNLFLYDIEVNGVLRQLALLKKEGSLGTFVNPENPEEQYQLPVASGTRASTNLLSLGKLCAGGYQSTILPLFTKHNDYRSIRDPGHVGFLCISSIWLRSFSWQGIKSSIFDSAIHRHAAAPGYTHSYFHFVQKDWLV